MVVTYRFLWWRVIEKTCNLCLNCPTWCCGTQGHIEYDMVSCGGSYVMIRFLWTESMVITAVHPQLQGVHGPVYGMVHKVE